MAMERRTCCTWQAKAPAGLTVLGAGVGVAIFTMAPTIASADVGSLAVCLAVRGQAGGSRVQH